jgi:hypothetical protein
MRFNKSILFCIFFVLVTACDSAEHMNAVMFKGVWHESKKQSEVTWFYLGESGSNYYIKKISAGDEKVLKVSKQALNLKGIKTFEYGSSQSIQIRTGNLSFN